MPKSPNSSGGFSADPVQEIYCVVHSLDVLASTARNSERFGAANMLDLIKTKIQNTTEHIDNSEKPGASHD